jgi:hypothetical protein
MAALQPSSKCSYIIEYDPLYHQAAPCHWAFDGVLKWLLLLFYHFIASLLLKCLSG